MDCEKQASEYCGHISALTGLDCLLLSIHPDISVLNLKQNAFCKVCKNSECDMLNTLYYGCSEAYRWNGKYVFYCPCGLTFIASSLTDAKCELSGGMICGPFILGEREALSEENSTDKCRGEGDDDIYNLLPVKDASTVHHIEQVLSAVTESVCAVSHSLYGAFAYEQEKLLADLYRMKDEFSGKKDDFQFLLRGERQLRDLVAAQDKEGAQGLLNELLGYIYFTGDADMPTVKARLIELLVVLSRAAIDAGANAGEILQFNQDNIIAVEKMSSLEEMSVWITGIMHRFIRYSFDFATVKHADTLHKIMQYVKNNCSEKITLDDIAANVYLSRSYISSMFKEETGESLFAYINRMRVEKSKTLLLNEDIPLSDVADFCGFDDQSYFTKVFKSVVGVSPKKYRDSRGRVF